MLEPALENRLEQTLKTPLERMQEIGWWLRGALLPIVEPHFGSPTVLSKPALVEWKERDDMIATCVKFGLNAREIQELSYSWPQPLGTVTRVYQKIEQLNLNRSYKNAQKKKRSGSHNQNIIYVFSKLTGQALECGFTVWDVMRDVAPEGARFRPDVLLRISRKRFFVEVQLSKIEGTRWGVKIRNYVRLYETLGEPFQVLILLDKKEDVSKVRRFARDTLKRHGRANLRFVFLVMTLHQFRFERNVVTSPVWQGAFHGKPFKLL